MCPLSRELERCGTNVTIPRIPGHKDIPGIGKADQLEWEALNYFTYLDSVLSSSLDSSYRHSDHAEETILQMT